MTKSNHFAKIVVKWILEKYEKEDIYNKIAEQTHEYLEGGWEEEFENEAEAYDEQGRGEAESDIITELLTEGFTHFHIDPEGRKGDPFVDAMNMLAEKLEIKW